MSSRVPMVLLTSVSGSFEARVLEARLRAEGIDAELRGALDGPYPFSVGAMAEVRVYVPQDQLEDARLVLLAAEVESAFERPHRVRPWRASDVAAVVAVLGILAFVIVARALAIF